MKSNPAGDGPAPYIATAIANAWQKAQVWGVGVSKVKVSVVGTESRT